MLTNFSYFQKPYIHGEKSDEVVAITEYVQLAGCGRTTQIDNAFRNYFVSDITVTNDVFYPFISILLHWRYTTVNVYKAIEFPNQFRIKFIR